MFGLFFSNGTLEAASISLWTTSTTKRTRQWLIKPATTTPSKRWSTRFNLWTLRHHWNASNSRPFRMTGFYRCDDHELYNSNLPHLTQNRSKKNALVHMSSPVRGLHHATYCLIFFLFLYFPSRKSAFWSSNTCSRSLLSYHVQLRRLLDKHSMATTRRITCSAASTNSALHSWEWHQRSHRSAESLYGCWRYSQQHWGKDQIPLQT